MGNNHAHSIAAAGACRGRMRGPDRWDTGVCHPRGVGCAKPRRAVRHYRLYQFVGGHRQHQLNWRLTYWWNLGGDTFWSQAAVPGPGAISFSDPAVAWTGTTVIITALGSNGMLYYFWSQEAGAPSWQPWQELPATNLVGPDSLANFNSFGQGASVAALSGDWVAIAAQNTGNGAEYYWLSGTGSSWPSSPQLVS